MSIHLLRNDDVTLEEIDLLAGFVDTLAGSELRTALLFMAEQLWAGEDLVLTVSDPGANYQLRA
jgi:hypothetical protein